MSHTPTATTAAMPPIATMPTPVRQLLPWAAFALLIAVVLGYFIGAEGGATAIVNGSFVHELTHDGRHLLGLPCH